MNDAAISLDGWVMRVRQPIGEGFFPVILMLHGWTGDENSMWVFAARLPRNAILVAPRGLYPAQGMPGYSWHPAIARPWPRLQDFQPAAEKIVELFSRRNFPSADTSRLHLLGFSQGSAFAYSITILHPGRVASLAGLSGFLPEGASQNLPGARLAALPVFIAHGIRDNHVPVDRARKSVQLLQQAGAQVTYCEDDVGHKLSARCFHGLEAFYQQLRL
ncbi:MAG: alpha/beta hydrolase [Acidobacteriaceae bacterium]